jgi:cytochrome c oxidase assembly protein subunit 11
MTGLNKNFSLMSKLFAVTLVMFAFGYLLVPMYKAFCEWTGVNILALSEREASGSMNGRAGLTNTQVDTSRTLTVEFDTNVRGPWQFTPEKRSVQVHPGELITVMFDFQNVQDRTMSAQAIPSYAPREAQSHFNKLECFCFQEHTLAPGEKKSWPVVFYVSPKLSKDIKTITLSYTFFEVGSSVPSASIMPVMIGTANES